MSSVKHEKCSMCGKFRVVNLRTDTGAAVCLCCNRKANKKLCSLCNNVRTVNSRNDVGEAVCSSCWSKLHMESCILCKRIKAVAFRNEVGQPLCANCLRKSNKKECCICGNIKPVAARHEGMPICANCRIMIDLKLLFKSYKYGAYKRNLEFNLLLEEFKKIVELPCFYCGGFNKGGLYSGLDRINNNMNYNLDNCVSCCGDCNRMKSNMSQSDFVAHLRRIIINLENE